MIRDKGNRYARIAIAFLAVLSSVGEATAGGVATVAATGSDIAFDVHTGMLYVSVLGVAGLPYGNRVVEVSPIDASITRSVFVGSDPTVIRTSADAAVAYVGLEGAAAVRRIDLVAMTADAPFAVGNDPSYGPLYPSDIARMPGFPDTIAVSLHRHGVSPDYAGVAIFDAGVRRPTVINDFFGPVSLAFGADAATLYGFDRDNQAVLSRSLVDASGVTVQTTQSLPALYGSDIRFDAGRIYSTKGAVFDDTFALVGTYAASGPIVVDEALALVYIVEAGAIHVFDRDLFIELYSMPVGEASDRALAATGCGVSCIGIVFDSGRTVVATVDEVIFQDGFEAQ